MLNPFNTVEMGFRSPGPDNTSKIHNRAKVGVKTGNQCGLWRLSSPRLTMGREGAQIHAHCTVGPPDDDVYVGPESQF